MPPKTGSSQNMQNKGYFRGAELVFNSLVYAPLGEAKEWPGSGGKDEKKERNRDLIFPIFK